MFRFFVASVVCFLSAVSFLRAAEDNKFCPDVKNHLQNQNIDGFIKSLGELYRSLHPNKNDTLQPEALVSTLAKVFEHCGIPTLKDDKFYLPMPNNTEKKEQVGTIELRTINYTAGNFVMKTRVGQKKTTCVGLRSLLKMVGTEPFNKLYGADEKILVFSITVHTAQDPVIPEWIGMAYKSGEIVEVKHHEAKCIETDEFKDLKYKEKHIKDHMAKA